MRLWFHHVGILSRVGSMHSTMKLHTTIFNISIPTYWLSMNGNNVGVKMMYTCQTKKVDTPVSCFLTNAITLVQLDITHRPNYLINALMFLQPFVEALTKLNCIDVFLASDEKEFITAMSVCPFLLLGDNKVRISPFDGMNMTGLFRTTFQKTLFFYYIVTEASRQARYPFPLNTAFKYNESNGSSIGCAWYSNC